jgi:hypothetical protein
MSEQEYQKWILSLKPGDEVYVVGHREAKRTKITAVVKYWVTTDGCGQYLKKTGRIRCEESYRGLLHYYYKIMPVASSPAPSSTDPSPDIRKSLLTGITNFTRFSAPYLSVKELQEVWGVIRKIKESREKNFEEIIP